MMHMEHRLAQTQTQRLMLTQRMQQAIQILQLSALELDQFVQQELETNPVLEVQTKQVEPSQNSNKSSDSPTRDDSSAFEDDGFDFDTYTEMWGFGDDFRNREGTDLSRNPDADARREHYENSITREESFSSRLLTQLRLAADNPRTYAIGERIIGDIDARGYFTGSLEAIAQELNAPVEEVESALNLIQHFEPTGVGARDVVECLILQIQVEYPEDSELITLVSNHLESLERRQIPKIAKDMGISPERVEELQAMLAKLDPWPGLEFASEPAQYVTPDVIVEKDDESGEYDIYLSNEYLPELRINTSYREMARAKSLGVDERKYIRDKLESARWLMRNIQQRQQTILRIARAIVDFQRDFLDHGIERIKPLTLQEIADRVGVHEATVSRTTRGKYIQTPQGLFEMKYFFSPGLKRDDGDAQSSKSVQSLIKKIIAEENKAKPLSDQKIADILRDQGISIARRTVTKYREAMDILPTNLRRSYQDNHAS